MMSHPKLSTLTAALGLAMNDAAFTPPQASGMVEPLSLMHNYPANARGRDFVVGDLHGAYELLMLMLKEINFDFEVDRLFSVGNLCDRGPDSVRCIRLIEQPWFKAVAGNHEEMLLRSAFEKNFNWQSWITMGGAWATALSKDELFELADLVTSLPLAIAVGEGEDRFNVLHAEYNGSDASLEDALETNSGSPVPLCLTWGRDIIHGHAEPDHEDLSMTFVGHYSVSQVGRIGKMVYLNTGAFRTHFRPDDEDIGMTIIEPAANKIYRSTKAMHAAAVVATSGALQGPRLILPADMLRA